MQKNVERGISITIRSEIVSCLIGFFKGAKKKKPVHIRLWEYGEEIRLIGTSSIEIINWAAREKISSIMGSEFTTINLLQAYVSQYLLETEGTVDNKTGGKLLVLKAEYLAWLEDFRQLEEEKKLVRIANWKAVIAVIVAALSLFANIGVSAYQINSPIEIITNKPIKLDTEQMQSIKDWIKQRKPETEKKANQ